MHNIGIGYSTDKSMVTGLSCLKSYNIDIIGTVESSATFGNQYTSFDIAKSFGFDISAGAKVFPFITGSVAATYAQYIQESRYSQTYNFLYQVNLGKATLNIDDYGLDVLNPFGLAAYLAGPKAFREACGDKFVVQQSLGARLYVTVKLNFATVADQKSFSVAVGSKVNLLIIEVDVQLKLKTMIEQKNLNLNLEVAAYQDGGDVIRLATIFNKTQGGAYYVMGCDVFNMAPCQEVINGTVNYAKLDFKDQIKHNNGIITGFPSSVGDVYASYTSIGLEHTNSTVTDKIAQTRLEMLGNYSQHTQEKEFLTNLLYNSDTQQNNNTYKLFDGAPNLGFTVPAYWSWSPNYIFTPIQLTLGKILNIITDNILLLQSDIGIPLCYQNPPACSPPQLQIVDHDLIKAFKKAYQIIAVCNEKTYNGYALPIDKNIYQETACFDQEIYFTVQYIMEPRNITTGEIGVSIVKDELTKQSFNCGSIWPKENQDTFVLYETTMVGVCGRVMCPDSVAASSTYMMFIEIETPI